MQTKTQSLIEATTSIGVGFIISVCVWQLLAKYYGYDMPLSRNLEITTIFTFVSISRSYVFRRIFTRWNNRSK
jgi:hypothetical protein